MTNTTERAREPRSSVGGGPTGRRRGRLVRTALAITLAVKVVLIALWYAGGLSGALALASEPRGAATSASHGDGAPHAGAGVPSGGGARATELANAAPAAAEGGKPADVRGLLAAVTRRQGELDAREREIATREERLRLFEQDVTAKVASLEEIEKRLQARAKAASAAVDAASETLAKVYGAMKPADAAPILERLDEATVLTIFGRMKEKQIGEILPLMSKEKAIALTHALAVSAPR